jgi:hypothetical protein
MGSNTQTESDLVEMGDEGEFDMDIYVADFIRATGAAITFKDYNHPDETLGCVTDVAKVFRRPESDTDALLFSIGRLSTRAFGYERTLIREAIIGKKVYPAEYRVKVWAI